MALQFDQYTRQAAEAVDRVLADGVGERQRPDVEVAGA